MHYGHSFYDLLVVKSQMHVNWRGWLSLPFYFSKEYFIETESDFGVSLSGCCFQPNRPI